MAVCEWEIFECRQCGRCCEGRGGIVLSDHDLERLAVFLGLGPDEVIAGFAEYNHGKLRLKAGEDGNCVFLKKGLGCAVHAGKPDICRAWPYFRGNLEDAVSLDMARDFCPGINRDISFEEFSAFGKAYLADHHLLTDDARAANSLMSISPAGNLAGTNK